MQEKLENNISQINFSFFRCPICRVDIEAQLCPSATVRCTLPGTGNKGPHSEPSPGSSSGAGSGPGSMDQGTTGHRSYGHMGQFLDYYTF